MGHDLSGGISAFASWLGKPEPVQSSNSRTAWQSWLSPPFLVGGRRMMMLGLLCRDATAWQDETACFHCHEASPITRARRMRDVGAPKGGGRGGAHHGTRAGRHRHAALRAHRRQGACMSSDPKHRSSICRSQDASSPCKEHLRPLHVTFSFFGSLAVTSQRSHRSFSNAL